ncbi:hypothetical protein BAY61_03100 [Prauserella marina]|uniref:Uncharacterized protein n=1 Tax=Prauserella marina TaxID=530584 RepID=A0A222VJP1_9PSEU|nr:hypothetical protein [Prauserella marina]ASR34146.1 hypothetical protein BAY61_03100 [Prauserella marina]PWV82795.1 hypothetical protein DES30_1021042 [Prauserella marina]SDC77447.1 hypothetical protein SAMN05421630_103578 [Prauserella marina]
MGETGLRRAAFGAEPGIDDRALAVAAALTGNKRDAARRRWLAAVVLGARGRYAAAASLLVPLARSGDPIMASLACTAFAAHRRQLGGHAAALPLDGRALVNAVNASGPADPDGLDQAGAEADALLGLAADNLALGRFTAARRLLARAVDAHDGWRARVRSGWVGAELALAEGAAWRAVPLAENAAVLARERAASRHVVKSDLVHAAALAATGEAGNRERARGLVEAASDAAAKWGLRSLTWPAGLLAADLNPSAEHWNRSRVTRELYALLSAADPEGRRLAHNSAWVPI